MVNSVESETKNRYELMTRLLPDDEEASNVTTRVVPIEESRRIDRIMTGSDADILGRFQGLSIRFFLWISRSPNSWPSSRHYFETSS